MDFLEIRRKAKERAAAEAGQPSAAPEPAPPAAAPPAAPSGAPDAGPALGGADVAAGRLAAGLQGLPPAPPEPQPPVPERDGDPAEEARGDAEAAGPVDARFTTWRPGSGVRPFVEAPEVAPEPRAAAREPAALEAAALRAASGAPPGPTAEPAPEPAPVSVPPRAPPAPRPEPAPRRAASYSPAPVRDPLEEFFYRPDEELPTATALPVDEEPQALEAEDAGVEEYLTFLLGAEEFAVAIERVREVLKSQAITEVPRAPAGILGVVTVRGEVVAVFDPRRRLGLPGPTPEAGLGRIVIVDDGEGPCGLLVDTVASVVRLARGSIEPTPQGIGGAAADCLAGIGREDGRLFTVLELAALLRRGSAAPRGGRRAHAGP